MPRGKRQQGDVPSLLDGAGKPPLVRCAHSGQPPRNDFAALSHEALQQADIAVWNRIDLLGTEFTHLLATEELAASAGGPGTDRRGGRGAGCRSRSSWCSRRCVRRGGRLCLCLFRHIVSSSLSSVRSASKRLGTWIKPDRSFTARAGHGNSAISFRRWYEPAPLLELPEPPEFQHEPRVRRSSCGASCATPLPSLDASLPRPYAR